jgi:hypothetical protein
MVTPFLRLLAPLVLLALIVLAWDGFASASQAQQAAGIDPGRDCQTVRTCTFSRAGRLRGCLSSYTCRTCRLTTQRCTLAGRSRCQQVVCTWGG